MAACLNQFFQSFRQGLEKVQQSACSDAQDEVGETAQFEVAKGFAMLTPSHPAEVKPCKTPDISEQRFKCKQENYLDRLPAEILLKILAFLDASSLFNFSFVNKRFHDLANNNALWCALYACETEKKKWRPRVCVMTEAVSTRCVEGKPLGYWKKLLLKEMAGYRDTRWKSELRHTNPHTGMPALTEQVLRRLHIQWEITLTHKNGRENVYEQTRNFFEDSSVTVCWNNGNWPFIYRVNYLQLHGIMCPALPAPGDRPRWRSLICKTKLHGTVHWSFLGADRHVKLLQFDEGIIVGIWRGNWKIAFIMATLHFHKLIERSLLGSRFCPYIPSQDNALDQDCGLHGYTLHIVLHNPVRQIVCRRFSPLFTTRVMSRGEYLQLSAIDFTDVSEHIPVGKINLPWQTEGLHETVEHCCLMTLTILDEAQRPFWCVSSPVRMSSKHRVVDLEYEGEQSFIFYEDAEGKVKMTFVWMEEFQQHFLVQLNIVFPEAKVIKHFGGKV